MFLFFLLLSCSRSSGSRSVLNPSPSPPSPSPSPVPPPVGPSPGSPSFSLDPSFVSPGKTQSPGFVVDGLPNVGVVVSLYRGPFPGSRCVDPNLIFIKKLETSGSRIVFNGLSPDLVPEDGLYKFFVKIERVEGSVDLGCLTLSYILDRTVPRVVNNSVDRDSLTNDDSPLRSKTWSWTCDDLTSCEYRYKIDSVGLSGSGDCVPHVFTSADLYSSVSKATQSGVTGKYCIHIQARDEVGLESRVTSVYGTFDNKNPSISGVEVLSGGL